MIRIVLSSTASFAASFAVSFATVAARALTAGLFGSYSYLAIAPSPSVDPPGS